MVAAFAACVLIGPVRADEPAAAKKYEVQAIKDVAYYAGTDAHPVKHKLDLFLPKGLKDFPVVFFVHGGTWSKGDKSRFGVYSALGSLFARHGVGAVVINYRLSPDVQHPEHMKDVARAFAWTYRNIEKHGGRKDQIFVCGHSAGGHLASLLATDEKYLRAEGLTTKAIKGVMPISGVYVIPENLLSSVFGTDPEVCKQASPINHVHEGAPPFLILYADLDLPSFDKMSEEFYRCLLDKKCQAQLVAVKERNHMGILFSAVRDDDPAAQALLGFIAKNCAPEQKAQGAASRAGAGM